MESTTENQKGPEQLVVCKPVSEGPPYVPSQKVLCTRCHREVWVANTSPQVAAICTDCFIRMAPQEKEEIQVQGPSLAQQKEMAEYYRAHPEEVPGRIEEALESESVTPQDLEDIPHLCIVIERLCDSLRNLRRENPNSFFGHPVERLYDSLEAALSSFYHSKVESTSPEAPSPETAS